MKEKDDILQELLCLVKNFPWSCQFALTTLVTDIGPLAVLSFPCWAVGPSDTDAVRFSQVLSHVHHLAGRGDRKSFIFSLRDWQLLSELMFKSLADLKSVLVRSLDGEM